MSLKTDVMIDISRSVPSVVLILMLVAVALALGCSNHPNETQQTKEEDRTVDGVTYVKGPLPHPGSEPPLVTLFGGELNEPIAARPEVVNWSQISGERDEVDFDAPITWPEPTARQSGTIVQFHSPAPPVLAEFRISYAVDPETGHPIDPNTNEVRTAESEVIECSYYYDQCMEFDGSIARWDVLPAEMAETEYINIYAHWVFPREDIGLGLVTGNWSFHFVNR